MDICNIIYHKDNNKFEFKCSKYSVDTIIEELKQQGAKIENVIIHKALKKQKKKMDNNEIEKRKYYNYRYTTYYRLLKNGIIGQETFNKIKEFLKLQKKTSKNKEQFEINFKKYIKALNL